MRSSAVTGLSVFGAQAEVAIPLLINALKDPRLLRAFMRSLDFRLFRPGGAKLSNRFHLIRAMTDPHANVRAKAGEALGTLGEPSDEVLSVLRRALDDADRSVRYYATNSLRQLTGS